MATCAKIVDAKLPNDAAEDSYNMLHVLLGKQLDKPVRRYMLEQTISLAMSIRDGNWKYLDHKGAGSKNYDQTQNSRSGACPQMHIRGLLIHFVLYSQRL